MPRHPMPTLTSLPAPTWSQSDNNLLPQWRRFVEAHLAEHGTDELAAARTELANVERYVEDIQRCIPNTKRFIAELTEQRQRYLDEDTTTDETIAAQYQRLIESPHVVGTTVGLFGELRILIDPLVTGYESKEFGLYELSPATNGTVLSFYRVSTYDTSHTPLEYLLDCYWISYGQDSVRQYERFTDQDVDQALRSYDLLSVVDALVEHVFTQYADRFTDDKAANRSLPWSGHNVNDPVRAMKMFLEKSYVDTPAQHASRIANEIADYEQTLRSYTTQLRDYRVQRREITARIAKLEPTQTSDGPSDDELARMLETITTMPGVMAVRFEHGIPVLHVRASFVHEGRRYDLGDYELYLKQAQIGTHVMRVNRTRIPVGGEYNSGWEGGGFCFGNRAPSMRDSFVQGDFVHAINQAIGALNSISEGDFDYCYFMFAEIPMEMVWQRNIRTRPRRRQMGRAVVNLIATHRMSDLAS